MYDHEVREQSYLVASCAQDIIVGSIHSMRRPHRRAFYDIPQFSSDGVTRGHLSSSLQIPASSQASFFHSPASPTS